MYYSLMLLSLVGLSFAAPYWPKINKSASSKNQKLSADKAFPYQEYDIGSEFFSRSNSKVNDYDYVDTIDAYPNYDYQVTSGSDFAPQTYHPPNPNPTYAIPEPFAPFARICSGSEVLAADGSCIEPEIIRNIFTFAEPENVRPRTIYPKTNVPKPKIKFNLVVIQANEDEEGPEPIVVPPPQEKTVVLVLKKEGEEEQKIIEVPAPVGLSPEVFFVNYKEGENPILPGGIDLTTALASSATLGTRVNSQAGPATGGGIPLDSGYARRSDTIDSGFGKENDDFRTNEPTWK